MVLVRALDGVLFPRSQEPVYALFALIGTKDERNYHLRALTAIAQIIQQKDFHQRWQQAPDAESVRNLLLLSERRRS